MKIGIQVSSFKPLLKTSEEVRQVFSKIAMLGCEYVQLQWIYPEVPLCDIADALESSGMRSVGLQDFYQLILDNFDYYVELNRLTGGRYVTVSRIPDRLKSREGLSEFVAELRQMQKRLDEFGQELNFHPVSADFAAVPGMDAVAYILDAMPELKLCLDLLHLNRSCDDMPAFIRRYSGRIKMVHFKDERDGQLVPAGSGEVRYSGIAEACLEAGVSYGFAEQESWNGDPYEALGDGLNWLVSQISAICSKFS